MRAAPTRLTRGDLKGFLELGLSIIAATRDDRMVVELTRCAGARLLPDGRVYVAISQPEGARSVANITATGVIALTCALPSNYNTVALKGTDAQPVEWPDTQRVVSEHAARFAQIMVDVGMTQGDLPQMMLWSTEGAIAIAFTPLEFFDQTPGPAAGKVLAP
jgi:hypothetical protein